MAKILDANDMFFTPFEPKTKNRFIMHINDVPAYMVKMANRPNIQFETIVLDHINIKRKLQGKGDWQDITIGLYDPIVPSAAQAVMEWVRLGHESLTGRRGYADFYKKDLTLELLGPVGDVVEQWTIKGALIVSTNMQEVDWASGADVAMIELTLAYDYAVLEF
jgi:hypothetical protein